MAAREVWVRLLRGYKDEDQVGDVDLLEIGADCLVAHLRKQIWIENKKGLLKGVSAAELKVYPSREACKPDGEALRPGAEVPTGTRDDVPLFVVAPAATGVPCSSACVRATFVFPQPRCLDMPPLRVLLFLFLSVSVLGCLCPSLWLSLCGLGRSPCLFGLRGCLDAF